MFGPSIDTITEAIEDVIRKVLDIGEGSVKKIQELKAEIRELREEKEDLEFKKKMEEKEIAHLVKMKEEKIQMETEKKEIELIKDFQKKEMALQTEYFDKVMETVKEGHKKMEDIYGEILRRLPNVNMSIRQDTATVKREREG